MTREPTVLVDAVRAFLVMLSLFGVSLTSDQIDAVVAFVGSLLAAVAFLGVTAWLRSKVTPVAAPQLPAGTTVTTTDASGAVTGTTTV